MGHGSGAEVSALDDIHAIVLARFPWLKEVRLGSAKGLSFRTASSKLHLEGDAGDPAAARVTDATAGPGIMFYPGVPGATPPSLWITDQRAEPYSWAKVSECLITGPLPTDAGTRIASVITTGSGKVTIAT